MNTKRLREIIRKEFRQTLRDPRMRVMLILPPLVQLLIFGYAVNLDVDHATMAWVDQDRTPASRDLLAGFEGSRRFQVVAAPSTAAEAQRLMDRGDVQIIVRVLPGFNRGILRGRTAGVQILLDGANSNTASIAGGYASAIVAQFAARHSTPTAAHLDARPRIWFNPDLRSRNYFVPGVVVNIIALVTISLTAMAIVREKEIGTMEQLMVTPIRPLELMLGKTLPFALVGIFDVVLVVVAAILIFDIPFRGSALLLLACSLLFLLTSLGAGLFLSTISKTQQQVMLSTFLIFLPALLLSGFTFPIRNMPLVIQWFTYLNPIRYFLEIVRGLFLKGSGVSVLWPQMLALAVFGTAILTLSVLRFRKRLD